MSKISELLDEIKVKDIMNLDVITIPSDAPVGDAAKIMLKNQIHGLPVVNSDNQNEVLKIVTSFDLLGLTYYGRFSEDTDYIKTTSVEKLTKDQTLISVSPDATIKDVLKISADKGISMLPVIDNGKMAGIVSLLDIIRKLLTL